MNIKKYRIILAYDGSNYCGWQEQPQPSIEGILKKTFTKTFGKSLFCVAASRTDAGVHALGQVVLCKFDLDIDPMRIAKIWNDALPADILIRSLTLASDRFHPWYNVIYKEYWYHIAAHRPLPFISPYVWYYRASFDHQKMAEALQLFVGTHDFTAFAHADDEREDMMRTIDSISVSYLQRFGIWQIKVVGKKFMRHMIRKMVGAALYVASNDDRPLSLISDTLILKQRKHELPTAPSHGLILRKIIYNFS